MKKAKKAKRSGQVSRAADGAELNWAERIVQSGALNWTDAERAAWIASDEGPPTIWCGPPMVIGNWQGPPPGPDDPFTKYLAALGEAERLRCALADRAD